MLTTKQVERNFRHRQLIASLPKVVQIVGHTAEGVAITVEVHSLFAHAGGSK